MQTEICISAEYRRLLNKDAEKCWEEKEFRPTGVAVPVNVRGEIMIVRAQPKPGRSLPNWGFPQGGIRQGEDVVEGLLREFREEVGFDPLRVVCCCHVGQYEKGHVPRPFRKGKRYYCLYVECPDDPIVRLQFTELIDYRWRMPVQVENLFLNAPPTYEKKAQQLLASMYGAGILRRPEVAVQQ
jgi:8-oxo-dGTP pyrophosphatase MutT (NUDIX family)